MVVGSGGVTSSTSSTLHLASPTSPTGSGVHCGKTGAAVAADNNTRHMQHKLAKLATPRRRVIVADAYSNPLSLQQSLPEFKVLSGGVGSLSSLLSFHGATDERKHYLVRGSGTSFRVGDGGR